MSTRSNIAIENDDGTVEVVYCHFDGYPEGIGKECLMRSTEELRAVIARGDMSSFGDHYVDRPNEKWEHIKPKTFASIRAWLEDVRSSSVEYCYVLTKKNVWKYAVNDGGSNHLKKLTSKVCGL